jgi:hypothetical protein
MTKYDLPDEIASRYIDCSRIANQLSNEIAEHVTLDLMKALKVKYSYHIQMGNGERAEGIWECVEHLKEFRAT